MSYTVALNGNTSVISCTLFPPLKLEQDRRWEIALLDFTTYNSIPNVVENVNNKLHYEKNDGTMTSVELDTGSYEIDDINLFLQKQLGETSISLKANNNIMRCEVKCIYPLDFTKEQSIGSLLGFSKKVLASGETHSSDLPVNIIKVNVINVTCNIVNGAYIDGVNDHIIHSFYPTVPPGFKIIEKPHNLIYLPVNVSLVSDIVLRLSDQDGDIVDFRGETVTVRLHIRSRE